jgi:hypothetical protein
MQRPFGNSGALDVKAFSLLFRPWSFTVSQVSSLLAERSSVFRLILKQAHTDIWKEKIFCNPYRGKTEIPRRGSFAKLWPTLFGISHTFIRLH